MGPHAVLSKKAIAYWRVLKPKMRRMNAKREHRRVDEPIVIAFLEAMAAVQGPDSYVFTGSGASFRWYHDRLVEFFGIMPKDLDGLSPASHRSGGATYVWEQTLSTEAVRFRGGWASLKSLETYIQEAGAASVLATLPDTDRNRILTFSDSFSVVLAEWLAQYPPPSPFDRQ